MKKLFSWGWNNILFLSTLFLLMFIPLYPKLPLLDVQNTWVYIRAEDFVFIVVVLLWILLLVKKKITLKTPLTVPILIYWIIGIISTTHGILLIFPQISNVFPNVAFLSFLRHVEYLGLFFVAYSGMKDKKFLSAVIGVLVFTLLLVIFYGIGQKYLGFPAFLTGNEEFAKGVPIRLSQLSRVPSTFAGHYDLAAYLVLVIPILTSLIFGFRTWFIKIFFSAVVILGIVLLFMTVSRVSFFVLIIALFLVLFFHNKKLALVALPIIGIFAFLFISFQPALISRFGNTVKEVDVLVDANTGDAIGHVKYVPLSKFKNKRIVQKKTGDNAPIEIKLSRGDHENTASPSAVLYLEDLPSLVPEVSEVNLSTGESLPSGTGYINLSLSPVVKKLKYFFLEPSRDEKSASSYQVFIFQGDYIIKKASAYDLSFTTRFQGEWPNALMAFKRNIFIGSGYGSVSLAVDNNYFRFLGETGLLGTVSFLGIFLSLGIYIKKILPNVDSKTVRSFVLGFVAGLVGLFLNATLIDIFEASKIAFLLYLLTGVVLGILVLYQTKSINLYQELKKALISTYAVIFYLFVVTFFIYSPMLNNFFVGDDFTWFRWAADSPKSFSEIFRYFTHADGFFYRPGTKIYFLLMYSVFWFNQVVYHAVSIMLHFAIATLFFLLAKKILRSFSISLLASFLFLLISGYSEAVFWISSTGYLFNAFFALSSLLLFIFWEEKRKIIYYVLSLIALSLGLLFHELGVVIPILMILYKFFKEESVSLGRIFKQSQYLFLFSPVFLYLILRYTAQSHWLSGDYSYNLIKLPFNIAGNVLGYLFLAFSGSISLPLYQTLRSFLKGNTIFSLILAFGMIFLTLLFYKKVFKRMETRDKKIISFGFLFFTISLLPFLGLGNITSRYSYLASLGLVLVFTYLIKKLYLCLKIYGKDIALLGTTISIGIFLLFHIIQVKQAYFDWAGAGEKSRKFFTSINALYSTYWSEEPVELHLVDVPIKYGQAWVFPVGLEDAVWLTFKNPSLKVYKHSTAAEALSQAGNSALNPIFRFKDDGSLEPIFRPKKIVIDNMQAK